ncbi:TetR/AcrR family transcriptional regulator [Thermoactinomyces mirandus]|uniref:TetR/AcrR family transcriptional regulator n=1 Tax=Thermoactinomyces mirandus TaxID=2756294 RepID=A0A7W1XT70_9BACL|nr:TetR/AcrR family transcriptional regulator [Thermoactinomyces mirandus]MBA4602832.1 TetR/AcrR family transcriptional regulator [Thermoactinomyces mirandus]
MRHEKVDVIFQAAIKVFADSGFDQARMDEIAKEAGVAKGTIYYHFKSKEDLFVGLMNEGVQKLIDFAKRSIKRYDSPTEQMQALVKSHVLFYVENGMLAKLLLSEAFGTKSRQHQFRMKIHEYLRLIETILRRGAETGEFKVKHVPEAASAFFGAASVVVLQKLYSLEESELRQIDEAVPQMIESLQHIVMCSIKNSPYL